MIEREKNTVAQSPARSPLVWIVLLPLVFRIGYHFFFLPASMQTGDTPDYLAASESCFARLLLGEVDFLRTPGYPLFLEAIRFFSGPERLGAATTICQEAVFLLAVFCFYRSGERLLKRRGVLVIATIFFACMPPLIYVNATLGTESLAISLVVFLLYLHLEYMRRPAVGRSLLVGVFPFLAIMLRPAFLLLLPVSLLFWSVRLACSPRTRNRDLFGLAGTLLAIFLVLGYCRMFERQHGIYDLTYISAYNRLHVLVQSGLYRNGSDPEINARIQANVDEFVREHPCYQPGSAWMYPGGLSDDAYYYVCHVKGSDYGTPRQIAEYADRTIREHPVAFALYTAGKILGLGRVQVGTVDTPDATENARRKFEKIVRYLSCVPFRLDYVYIFLLVELLLLLRVRTLFDPVSQCRLLCWGWTAGMIFTAIAAGIFDWGRTIMPILPLLILLYARCVDMLFFVRKNMPGFCSRYENEPSLVAWDGDAGVPVK